MSVALHWFRTDLRIADNPGLVAAQRSGLPVAALYIATPQQWDAHDDAAIKRDFWRRNLLRLQDELKALGIPLLCVQVPRYRDIPALLTRLLPQLNVAELHCNTEVPLNERERDDAVAMMCRQQMPQVAFHRHNDQFLLLPDSVLNKAGQPFKVFTPYARAVRDKLATPAVLPVPSSQPALRLPAVADAKSVTALDFGQGLSRWQTLWPAGEQEAQARLKRFCQQRIVHYQEARDFPADEGTSSLSPYLAAGVVSARQCWRESSQWQDGKGVHTWQNELLWREFYRYVMWHYPHVCRHRQWRDDVGHVHWRHDEKEFNLWCEGRTGIPLIDAAQQQLQHTGWMHNRLRMVSAMFLSKHLLIDWRWGERWFMQHLIDGDFASNNGGWQWSASTGTDAAPYFRIFNPVNQSRRYDPEGKFIRRYLPQLAIVEDASLHDPALLRPDTYPLPMIDLAFGRERALNAFAK